MKRKLVMHGKTSLSITLPKGWTNKHKLKKGNEINIIEDKGDLLISSNIKQEVKRGILDTNKLNHFNKNYLNSMYKSGYDEIKVLTSSLKTFNNIQERISWMIGYEIFDRDKECCTIKAVSKELPEEFDALLRKAFLVTLELADEIYLNVTNIEELKQVRGLEQANNKFTELCGRILYKHGYKNQDHTIFLYCINRDLERIADRYKYLADYVIKSPKLKIHKETLELLKEVNNYLRIFYTLFYKFTPENAQEYNNQRYKIIKTADELIEKLSNKNPKELIILCYLKELTQLIYEPYNPYFSMIL